MCVHERLPSPAEYKMLHLRALLSRAHAMMRRRDFTPAEFVQLCDRDGDGFVTRAELQSALRWLGVECGADLIVELVEHLDRRPPGVGPPGVLEQRRPSPHPHPHLDPSP